MEILCQCPGNLATGGTEGIHNLARELNKYAPTKLWYINGTMPKQFKEYGCDYVINLPNNFDGVVIFPEVWANKVVLPEFKNINTAVLWQGVDVYDWSVMYHDRLLFLNRTDVVHIAASDYAMDMLNNLDLHPYKLSDCLNDKYYQQDIKNGDKSDLVLYNPLQVKMTRLQRIIMARCTTELGIKFIPLAEYGINDLIDIFKNSKLYIDFGKFSGRERLPREAVSCGCCIITSNRGAASRYTDEPIPDRYKINDVNSAIDMIQYVLKNYDECKGDFAIYRKLLKIERYIKYPEQVKEIYNALLDNYTCV